MLFALGEMTVVDSAGNPVSITTGGLMKTLDSPVGETRATYSTAVIGLVAANLSTDIFTINGSDTKLVKVTRIALTGTRTTATQTEVQLVKRSTANTGGTATVRPGVPHDSVSPVPTAVVRTYTANPTTGTLVGVLRTRKVYMGTTTLNSDELIFTFGDRPAQSLVLRGSAETLALNLNGVTVTGNNLDVSIEWTEE